MRLCKAKTIIENIHIRIEKFDQKFIKGNNLLIFIYKANLYKNNCYYLSNKFEIK